MTRRRIETRGVKSYPSALEKGIRSERALKLAVAEQYVRGVSSREVAAITEPLCGPEVTDSQVSRAAEALAGELEKWRPHWRDALPDPGCRTSTPTTASGVARVPSWSPVHLSDPRDSSDGGRRKRRARTRDTARVGRIDRGRIRSTHRSAGRF
jgi:hypothetical protein